MTSHAAFAFPVAVLLALHAVPIAVAAGPEPGINVNIVNPLPVPISGSISVPGGVTVSGSVTVNNPATSPVQVTGDVDANVVLPATAFSYPPKQLSIAAAGAAGVAPDPSGTRFAITSVTITNGSAFEFEAVIQAFGLDATNTDCGLAHNSVSSSPGPRLFVPAKSTVHVAYPQPFVTAAVTGPKVCLLVSGSGIEPSTWSIVGYRILP